MMMVISMVLMVRNRMLMMNRMILFRVWLVWFIVCFCFVLGVLCGCGFLFWV